MRSKSKEWLKDNQSYINILKAIIKYEENNQEPDHHYVEDTDYDSYWKSRDIGAHPNKIYQLEVNGFVDRVYDSSNKTVYTLEDRSEIKDIISEVEEDMASEGDKKYSGEVVEAMHSFPSQDDLPDGLFDEIIGYDDAKWLIKRGLTTDKITNFLLIGDSGTAKTVFLMSIMEYLDDAVFVSASESTSAGVIDKMFTEKPRYMLIDEFDDMENSHQSAFASYTETGIVDETKFGKDRKMETNTKTFAAANDRDKIKDNIFDRFNVIEFERYTYDEFIEVCEHLLPMKEGKTPEESKKIAEAVWDYKGEGDVRAAIQVARLSRDDPEKVVGVLDEYSGSSELF